MLLEQLNSVLSSDEALPDSLILVNASEWQGQVRNVMMGCYSFITNAKYEKMFGIEGLCMEVAVM